MVGGGPLKVPWLNKKLHDTSQVFNESVSPPMEIRSATGHFFVDRRSDCPMSVVRGRPKYSPPKNYVANQ